MSGRRYPLLPAGGPLGWTPYAWLIYLPTFLIEPVLRTQAGHVSAAYLASTVAGLAVFLVAYFRSYWVRGRKLLPLVAVITALAVGYAPFNTGACVFYVYATAMAAQLDRTREAVRLVVGITLLGLLVAYLIDAPGYFWITTGPIALIIGGVNLHFAQAARSQQKLRLAQHEIEHLAAVAERERIARDLHDVLGHTLSLIVLKAELAGKLADRDPARAAAEMRDVENVARRTLQEVREAIRGYHPTLSDEAERSRAMLKAAGIACAMSLQLRPLPPPIEETLALALREAVTNVVRHSGASLCRVRLLDEDGTAALEVDDDGRGASAPEGSGLRGMRERVEALGGTLSHPPGRGMRLRIVLPTTLPAAPSDAARRGAAG